MSDVTPAVNDFVVRADAVYINPGNNGVITRRCAPGEQVAGGGCSFGVDGGPNTIITTSAPNGVANDADGWTCAATNKSSRSANLEVYVVCASSFTPPTS